MKQQGSGNSESGQYPLLNSIYMLNIPYKAELSLQLGELHFGLEQDRIVGIGILPYLQKIFVGSLGAVFVSV